MDNETTTRLVTLEKKLDAVYASTERTRRYLLITLVVTVLVLVLPLIGLVFAIPAFISSYSGLMNI